MLPRIETGALAGVAPSLLVDPINLTKTSACVLKTVQTKIELTHTGTDLAMTNLARAPLKFPAKQLISDEPQPG